MAPGSHVQGWLEHCPACGTTTADSRKIWFKHGHAIYRCPACKLLYVNPQPNTESILTLYGQSYFEAGGFDRWGYRDYDSLLKLKNYTFQRWLADLESFAEKGRLLEIGCGTGLMLEIARQSGWDVTGVELSEYAANHARSHGLEVHTGVVQETDLPVESYDVVLMLDLLEHVPNPLELFESVGRLLKPGGLVYIVTPNTGSVSAKIQGVSWPHVKPEEHLCLFSKGALQRLIARSSLELIALSGSRKVMTFDHLINELGQTNRVVSVALRGVCRIAPGLRTHRFYLPLGEMRAVARKPQKCVQGVLSREVAQAGHSNKERTRDDLREG